MAQALGGTYGLPHGAMNALCLPPALSSTARSRPRRSRASARRSARGDAATVAGARALGGFDRLRDVGVPEDDLPGVAEAAAGGREPGEPAPGHGRGVEELLRSIW